jgi:hypothetical protein
MLFVVDCPGNIVTARTLGAVKTLRAGPSLPIGETAEVVYLSGWGTGIVDIYVGLFWFNGNGIERLWRHAASADVSAPSIAAEFTETYYWDVSPDGRRIHVTGHRRMGPFKDLDYGWAPHTDHALPSQSYCWVPKRRRYYACR